MTIDKLCTCAATPCEDNLHPGSCRVQNAKLAPKEIAWENLRAASFTHSVHHRCSMPELRQRDNKKLLITQSGVLCACQQDDYAMVTKTLLREGQQRGPRT